MVKDNHFLPFSSKKLLKKTKMRHFCKGFIVEKGMGYEEKKEDVDDVVDVGGDVRVMLHDLPPVTHFKYSGNMS